MAWLTAAVITTGSIDAYRTLATSQTRAFIHVKTLNKGIAIVSSWADTVYIIVTLSAFGSDTTRIRPALGLLLSATPFVGIACGTRIAGTVVRYYSVFAVCILATTGLTDRRLRRRHTHQVRIAYERWLASTFACATVTVGADSTHDSLAPMLATATNAHLGRTAGVVRGALVSNAGPAREWISVLSRRTFACRAAIGYNA